MPGLVGHLAGGPLEIDATLEPVHAQRDGVLDARLVIVMPGLARGRSRTAAP